MLTKKHFIRFAKLVREFTKECESHGEPLTVSQRTRLVIMFVHLGKESNPNFHTSTFVEACAERSEKGKQNA